MTVVHAGLQVMVRRSCNSSTEELEKQILAHAGFQSPADGALWEILNQLLGFALQQDKL